VVEGANGVGGERITIDFGERRGDVERGGGADAEFEVAADGAAQPGRFGDGDDLRGRCDAAVLAGVDAEDVRGPVVGE